MGVTHKPNWAWLLDPLHLQQQRYLCPPPPPTHTRSLSASLSRVSLSHLSLGFYNACLQIRDPLSAAMHHCQQDRGTWFPYTDLWQHTQNNPSIGHLNLSQQIWCRSSVGELLVRCALSSPRTPRFVSESNSSLHHAEKDDIYFIWHLW